MITKITIAIIIIYRVFGIDIGSSLSSQLSSSLSLSNSAMNSYTSSKPSMSIQMTMTTTGTACTAPTAILNLQNIIGTVLYATNLDLKNCQVGTSIYADFKVFFYLLNNIFLRFEL